MNKKKLVGIITIIIVLILIDQVTKIIAVNNNCVLIKGILNITTVKNKGGAFGVGQKGLGAFIMTNIVVLGIIMKFMVTQRNLIDKKTYFALCMVIAGGLGNLIDRLFKGAVIDFLDFTPVIKFPVFNVADIYIVIGWILLALFFAIFMFKDVKVEDDDFG